MIYDSVNFRRKYFFLAGILFIGVLVSGWFIMPAEGNEIEYENYILIEVFPDDTILMTLRGSHNESISPWEQLSAAEELNMNLEIIAAGEGLTTIESDFFLRLNPSIYAPLANLDVDLEGQSDATSTNLTVSIDYPGYLDVDGSLGIAVVEPPYGLTVDLELEMALYYTAYPEEGMDSMVGMLPLLETQFAAQIMEMTDGHIVLERLELLGFEKEPDHASFTVSVILSGDFQKGLQYLIESMGVGMTPPEEPDEAISLSLVSADYQATFEGNTLSLEAETGGSVSGDFAGQVNYLKDLILEQLLSSDDIGEDGRTLVARALPIDLEVQHLSLGVSSTLEDDVIMSSFSLEGLGLKPPSFETLLLFLEDLSEEESPEGFKLILEGETSGNRYVVFDVPADTGDPIIEEEQRIVWSLDNIENLDQVTYESKTKQLLDTTTTVVVSAVGLVIIVAAGYYFMKR